MRNVYLSLKSLQIKTSKTHKFISSILCYHWLEIVFVPIESHILDLFAVVQHEETNDKSEFVVRDDHVIVSLFRPS